MDGTPEMELDRDQLISLVGQLREERQPAQERIAELERKLGKRSTDTRLAEDYSLAGGADQQPGIPPPAHGKQNLHDTRPPEQTSVPQW